MSERVETGACFCGAIAAEMHGEPFWIAVDAFSLRPRRGALVEFRYILAQDAAFASGSGDPAQIHAQLAGESTNRWRGVGPGESDFIDRDQRAGNRRL